jgi:hypothetical protein
MWPESKSLSFIIITQANKPGHFVIKIPSNNKVQSFKQVKSNKALQGSSKVLLVIHASDVLSYHIETWRINYRRNHMYDIIKSA